VKPGDGAVLNEGPSTIAISMSQEMFLREGANDIDVFDSAGREVTSVAAVVDRSDRRKLTVVIVQALEPGTYRVEWKTLSAEDGDAANGTLSFTLDPDADPDPGVEQLKEGPPATVPGENTTSGEGGAIDIPPPAAALPGQQNGRSWVFVIAVGLISFTLGGGLTYLLVQKAPE
jgi:methionine-rich copper-binding protein CopC